MLKLLTVADLETASWYKHKDINQHNSIKKEQNRYASEFHCVLKLPTVLEREVC